MRVKSLRVNRTVIDRVLKKEMSLNPHYDVEFMYGSQFDYYHRNNSLVPATTVNMKVFSRFDLIFRQRCHLEIVNKYPLYLRITIRLSRRRKGMIANGK